MTLTYAEYTMFLLVLKREFSIEAAQAILAFVKEESPTLVDVWDTPIPNMASEDTIIFASGIDIFATAWVARQAQNTDEDSLLVINGSSTVVEPAKLVSNAKTKKHQKETPVDDVWEEEV
jgi:hypothetical protein